MLIHEFQLTLMSIKNESNRLNELISIWLAPEQIERQICFFHAGNALEGITAVSWEIAPLPSPSHRSLQKPKRTKNKPTAIEGTFWFLSILFWIQRIVCVFVCDFVTKMTWQLISILFVFSLTIRIYELLINSTHTSIRPVPSVRPSVRLVQSKPIKIGNFEKKHCVYMFLCLYHESYPDRLVLLWFMLSHDQQIKIPTISRAEKIHQRKLQTSWRFSIARMFFRKKFLFASQRKRVQLIKMSRITKKIYQQKKNGSMKINGVFKEMKFFYWDYRWLCHAHIIITHTLCVWGMCSTWNMQYANRLRESEISA